MIRYGENAISFEETDLDRFSKESGDRNPLHMDESYARVTIYGERVVFGMLGVIALLKEYDISTGQLDIKFNSPIFLNRKYYHFMEEKKKGVYLYLTENHNKLIEVRVGEIKRNEDKSQGDTVKSKLPMLRTALFISEEEIEEPYVIEGEYKPDTNDLKDLSQEEFLNQILKLCSYAVGMVSPGECALFVRASLDVKNVSTGADILSYRIIKVNYNPAMKILENRLEIFCDTKMVAICEIQAYVREIFKLEVAESKIINETNRDKVVLIVGGTKGLGAEIAKEYVFTGATVIITYYHSEEIALELLHYLLTASDKVELVRRNMSDYNACNKLKKYLEEKYSVIDRLYLCAALPSRNMEFYPEAYPIFENYMNSGMQIFYYPFFIFQQIVASQGKIIVLSSVATVQKKEAVSMLDYICVKTVVENIVECSYYKNRDKKQYFVARPPKMLTEMNNTPIGKIGAVSPKIIARQMVDAVEAVDAEVGGYRVLEF